MTAYATRKDVRELGGIPRGLLANEGRLVASCLASTNTLELNEHGFDTDDEVTLRAAEGGTLSAPLVSGVTYYAINTGDSTFQLAATPAGSAIDITTDGVSMIVTSPLPIDRMLEAYSRWVDSFLPAHVVPLPLPVDDAIAMVVARLVGKALMNLDGKASDIVNAAELVAKAQVERWATGIPLRNASPSTVPANLSVTSTAGAADPRGWGSRYLP